MVSRFLLCALMAASLSLFGQTDNQGPKQDIKDAGSSTKHAAKKTGHKIKHGTKKVVNKSAKETKKGADKVEDKTNPK